MIEKHDGIWNSLYTNFLKQTNCRSIGQYLQNLRKNPKFTKEGANKSYFFRKYIYEMLNQPRTKVNEKNLNQFDRINKQNWNKLKQIDDIFKFNQKRIEAREKFINLISNLNYEKQPRQNKLNDYIVIMGSISAGKSSILNKLLDRNLQIGVGETTLSVQTVYYNDKVNVNDSPGINKDYDIFDVEVLKGLLEMDIFIVCYQNCFSQVYEITRVLSAISKQWGQKLYLVRTQCDRFSQSDELKLEQQVQIDRQYVKDKFRLNIEILVTSAKSYMSFYDNQRLQNILTGNKQDFQQLKEES